MRFDPGLDTLFILLQEHELSCGLDEIGRLKAVFALQPDLDEEGLRRVLEATLVKSVDQREIFRRAYSKWLTTIDSYIDKLEAATNREIVRKQTENISPAPAAHGRKKATATESRLASGPGVSSSTGTGPGTGPASGTDSAGGSPPGSASNQVTSDGKSASPESAGLPAQDATGARSDPASSAKLGGPHDADRPVTMTGPSETRHPAAVAVAVLLLVAGVVLAAVLVGDTGGGNHDPIVDAGAPTNNGFDPASNPEIASYPRFVVPEIVVETDQPPPFNWLGLATAVLALAMFIGLSIRHARGRWLPRTMPPRRLPRAALLVAPGRVPGRGDDEVLLLDEDDEDHLIWGVGRFISEEESRDLDVERSVGETAAAFGRPVLRYEHARYQREVWLWVDESIGSPAARHLARDLARLLERSGLPVTRAEFWGIPDKLRSEKGEVLIVDELDARRDSVAIAILTDGRIMAAAHRARDRRGDLDLLLRTLSHWPRVTFIDFARDNRQLSAVVASHNLRVIQPRESAAAVSDLASLETQAAEYDELAGDAQVWAAACAISPQPVDDRTALSLRRLLGLEVTPWVIEAMRDRAASNAGGLRWSLEQRASLLDWLMAIEELPDDLGKRRFSGFGFRPYTVKLPPACLLDRIMDAWTQLLDEREREGRKRDPGWETSRRAQEIGLERAFIHLWDMPNRSAAALYEIYRSQRFRRTIEHHLRQMAPRECIEHDHGHSDVIVLPWRLRHLRRETQVRLTEMGFGSKVHMEGTHSMPRPGRIYLALGLCLGLLVGSVASLVDTHLLSQPAPPMVIEDVEQAARFRAHVVHDCDGEAVPCTLEVQTPIAYLGSEPRASMNSYGPETGPRVETSAEYRATMGSGSHGENGEARTMLTWRETARIEWSEELALPCNETQSSEYGTVAVRRCASNEKAPIRPDDRWSFAAIHDDRSEPGLSALAERVANELLDSGSVDGVYLTYSNDGFNGIPWARLARPDSSDQLLVVARTVPASLAKYPGNAVVVDLDSIGALSGVTEGFGAGSNAKSGAPEMQTLAERFADYKPPEVLAGTLEDFRVHGQGTCGLRGQRCCYGSSDECQRGLQCVDDRCVSLPRICEAGVQRQCNDDDNYVQICDHTGTGWDDAIDCGEKRCVEGACKDVVCQPREWDCIDDQTLRLCNATGTGAASSKSCAPGICIAGACRNRQCEPDERRCAEDDRSYYICDRLGTGWKKRVSCQADQVCIKGSCRAQTCTPDTSRCADQGRSVKRCDSAGTRELRIPCPAGRLCRGQGCQPILHAQVDFRPPRLDVDRGGKNPGILPVGPGDSPKKTAPNQEASPSSGGPGGGPGSGSGSEADIQAQNLSRSITLRCSVTDAGSINLPPGRSKARPVQLRAPYSKTRDRKSRGFTVTCGLSILGKQAVATSRNHSWDLGAEGPHRMSLEFDIEGIRKHIPRTRELPHFDWGRVELVIDYSIALQLAPAKASEPGDRPLDPDRSTEE